MANEYITASELKASLTLTGQSYADADIALAVESASRAIDDNCGRRFYSATDTRYYTADPCDDTVIVDDVLTITGSVIYIDTAGNGTFTTTLSAGTHFELLPFNNPTKGWPYDRITLRTNTGAYFPSYIKNVKIIGSFGWTAVPPPVKQYAQILSTKLLLRSRQAPFGVLSYGLDQPMAVRIARNDPDFERILGNYVSGRLFI